MLSIPQGFSGLVLMPLMILYSAFCLKRLYELSTGNIILRTLLFLVILGIAFVILSVVMAIVMFLNGDLEQMIEAQKAARGT
ncbi:hypothetical protein RXV94_07480 [Yeosuana sp. MJ-SS3]|uniref:Uncharacterized protein n=1 Tax=Gilvirhabdus luticola TaxID=3079858 RepID=A0ABU3U6I6_9FLAO|nr:hypothetical protein [Yeosuana sp. MJ-SS3]MDU8885996.1 hypothetical protein [Yeosuana sp. MJ-SS3]